MKIEAPVVPSLVLAPVNLCSGCGKLRENERIRSMCNELRVGSDWNQTKVRRDVVPRNGEKYDVTQLLEEELESLDSLNEEEIRKRLISMELDHDRRRNDIEVCIDELKKASDRVAGYIAGAKKSKDLESSSKFNVEDYVFQLGRHFSHNLSSIDHKLRQFKENLSPLEDS